MKFVGIKEFYNITRAKIVSAVNCCIVVSLCATATFAVDSALDRSNMPAQPIETGEITITVVSYPEGYDPTGSSVDASSDETTNTTETTEAPETSETSATSETSESTEASTSEASTSETSATTSATTSETTKSTEATTTTTKETKPKITESELMILVYATTTVNVRKGPGTEYDVVKSVHAGDKIDVVAVTSNGWYKTYNGNYIKKSYTTETKPTNTPTPKPKATATPKPKATNTPAPKATNTPTPKPKATNTPAPKPSGQAVNCKITFYGPQLMKDGTYSKSTASGTTCKEGRTVAADWSIFPKGTVIYIENDPLGGDGYYTVEDKGGAVKGYIIDIYAEDGESGKYKTCYRNVYVK